jgi:sugar phosphate isomerase/epimerase
MLFTRRELAGLFAGAATQAKPPKVDITRISAISDEIAKSPADAIAFARKYGLRWLELRDVPGGGGGYPDLTAEKQREASREFRDNGIGISFLDAALFKFPIPDTEPVRGRRETGEQLRKRLEREAAQFEKRMDDLRRAIDCAHVMDCRKVRVFAFARVAEPEKILPRVAGIFAPMVELAAKEKVRLLLENEGSCNVATCAEMAEMARLVPSKWFGLNFDTLNGGQKEEPFPYGYSLLPKKRIGNFHIKGRAVLPGPQRQDWAAIFRAAAADGYREQFGLETHIFGPGQVQASHDSMQEILRILASL